ncbi:MAG: hypothetical protein Q7R39_02275 [Dehalococcoidia bacterium]|nr:hypothetical protein [Dehalococcoidia bacterium]
MKALLAGLFSILLVGCVPSASPTPTPPVATKAAAVTPVPTAAPKPTSTPTPTYLLVCNTGGIGAYIRTEPNGTGIIAWRDGTRLEMAGADQTVDGAVWRHVQDGQGMIGWMKADYLCPSGAP